MKEVKVDWVAKNEHKHWAKRADFILWVEMAGDYWMWWVNDTLETVADGRAPNLLEAKRRAEEAAHDMGAKETLG